MHYVPHLRRFIPYSTFPALTRKNIPPDILEEFVSRIFTTQHALKGHMAALIDAIDIKRKMFFELDGTPFHCLDVEVNTPTARGGQTLVRLKMRTLLTRAVFDKPFKASDKFRNPTWKWFRRLFYIAMRTVITLWTRRALRPLRCHRR